MADADAERAALAIRVARALDLRAARGGPLADDLSRPWRSVPRTLGIVADALATVRANPAGPSVGDILGAIADLGGGPSLWPASAARRVARPGKRALARELQELEGVVSVVSFARSKRAERARLVPELLLLFALEGALPKQVAPADDLETRVRDVRRVLDSMTR